MTVVVDTSVLIAFFNSKDAHHQSAKDVLAQVADEALVASSMTWAEVLAGPARSGEESVQTALSALAQLEIYEEAFPRDVAVRLAWLRAETGLKMPDCCVLLAAETAQADSVATFDGQLASASIQRGLTARTGK
ncbi:type II toxin-antitoxin system VapC family toxin (plasmid) [Mycobacterium avium subsp. hominissuis]|uniref:type II toxin-antitoxin system VapC family toxin n=1 Tax=Mycobacterium avium TaxID=1764 RepID=UPI0031402AAD